jgi:hypothetical protein
MLYQRRCTMNPVGNLAIDELRIVGNTDVVHRSLKYVPAQLQLLGHRPGELYAPAIRQTEKFPIVAVPFLLEYKIGPANHSR